MGIYSVGGLIRRYRVEHRISQEELAEGICSVPTLSRIENGERLPSKANYDALMQRLGYSTEICDLYINDHECDIHELRYKLRLSVSKRNFTEARQLLEQMKLLREAQTDKLNKQFILYMEENIKTEGAFTKESIRVFEKAIRMTLINYGKKRISQSLLTNDEIAILNNIAISYGMNGDGDKAIQMYYELKEYAETKFISHEEKMKIYPFVLYNLTKELGQKERFEECINVCDYAMVVLKGNMVSRMLGAIIYNKAWALKQWKEKQGESTDYLKYLLQAYYFEKSFGDSPNLERMRQSILEDYPLYESVL